MNRAKVGTMGVIGASLLLTSAAALEASSVGWWRFEGDGSNSANPGFLTANLNNSATALSTDVAHATIIDPITSQVFANTNSLKLTTGYGGSVTDDPALDAPSFTIEAFVRLKHTGSSYPSFITHKASGTGWQLDMDPGSADPSRPRIRIDTSNASPDINQVIQDNLTDYRDDVWRHVALTFDKSTGRAQFYVDHRLAGRDIVTGNLDNVHNVAANLQFLTSSAFGPDAALDEVRYSNAALSRDAFLRAGDKLTAYFNDFDGGQRTAAGVNASLSGVTTTESVGGYTDIGSNAFSGNFLRNTSDNGAGADAAGKTVITLTDLPSHSHIDIRFLLAIIDSWDGTNAPHGPDYFNVVVDGVSLISQVFPASGEITSGSWIGNAGASDRAYDSLRVFPSLTGIAHTSDTLTIELFASGQGYSGGTDESWAVENFEVILTTVAVPEPAMIAPLALLAGALIRRR